jgi:hypothetical protein
MLASLLPAIATAFALLMYGLDRGAFCNAFLDDCVSISRMAKYGIANDVFHAMVIPGGILQGMTWMVAAEHLAATGTPRRQVAPLLGLGMLAAVTLVIYGSFLGSDGATYRWLRRWGPLMYFGGTYLAMLYFVKGTRSSTSRRALAVPTQHGRAMVGLLAFVTAICVIHAAAGAGPWPEHEDRIENLSEWWGATALTLAFVSMALTWRAWGLRLQIRSSGPWPRELQEP